MVSLPHDEACRLPLEKRLSLIEHIRVYYPRWEAIENEIAFCHEISEYAAEPPCTLIVGPPGVGKTTLIESYIERYPTAFTETGKHIPVLKSYIPPSATEGKLVSTILEALGDPRYEQGKITDRTIRIRKYFHDCKVRLIILDELQHFKDRDGEKLLLNATNWLKNFIKDCKVGCILVGSQGESEQVISSNPQLASLFGDPLILEPFGCDTNKKEPNEDFRETLEKIEHLLPLQLPSNLADSERAWRCYVACGGVMRYLMRLIRRAARVALGHGQEYIDNQILSFVYNQWLAGLRRQVPNPFLTKELPPLPEIPDADSQARKASKDATNNRSNRQNGSQSRLKDFQ